MSAVKFSGSAASADSCARSIASIESRILLARSNSSRLDASSISARRVGTMSVFPLDIKFTKRSERAL